MALCSFVFFRCFEKKLQLTSDEATCFSWGNHQPARPCSESAAETAAEHDSLGPGPAVVEKQLRPPPPTRDQLQEAQPASLLCVQLVPEGQLFRGTPVWFFAWQPRKAENLKYSELSKESTASCLEVAWGAGAEEACVVSTPFPGPQNTQRGGGRSRTGALSGPLPRAVAREKVSSELKAKGMTAGNARSGWRPCKSGPSSSHFEEARAWGKRRLSSSSSVLIPSFF